jgi:hypothetical protein
MKSLLSESNLIHSCVSTKIQVGFNDINECIDLTRTIRRCLTCYLCLTSSKFMSILLFLLLNSNLVSLWFDVSLLGRFSVADYQSIRDQQSLVDCAMHWATCDRKNVARTRWNLWIRSSVSFESPLSHWLHHTRQGKNKSTTNIVWYLNMILPHE